MNALIELLIDVLIADQISDDLDALSALVPDRG